MRSTEPGPYTAGLRHVGAVVEGQLRTIPDPGERVAAISVVLAELHRLSSVLADMRQVAVGQANDGGLSYRKLARIMGLTPARAQQMVNAQKASRSGASAS